MAFLHASSSIIPRVFRRFVPTAALVLLAGTGLSLLPPCLAQSGSWTPTGDMVEARHWHAATLLHNGRVLVEGGSNSFGVRLSAEIYDSVKRELAADH
jgi:hypothetical protein